MQRDIQVRCLLEIAIGPKVKIERCIRRIIVVGLIVYFEFLRS